MLYQLPLAPKYGQLSDEELRAGIAEFKRELGDRLVILGHHYQQDDVIEFADFRGDSLKLSQIAAEQTEAEFIVFCGVHFMAESADILTSERQKVILPDLSAGCSMADMAHVDDVEAAWPLIEAAAGGPVAPITYVNSSAAVKAFVGQNDGACCTSSNARCVVEWAFDGAEPDGDPRDGRKVFFLPDQHLGRNISYSMGWPLESMVIWDPKLPEGGLKPEQIRAARVILWKGHCSVHQLFNAKQIEALRAADEPWRLLSHPECAWEVVQASDYVGSTDYIIRTIEHAEPGSYWAVGTEAHLVNRLAAAHPDKRIRSIAGIQCLCTTMYRIDLKHLYWTLEKLVQGEVVNRIHVDEETAHWSRVALDRMLNLAPASPIAVKSR